MLEAAFMNCFVVGIDKASFKVTSKSTANKILTVVYTRTKFNCVHCLKCGMLTLSFTNCFCCCGQTKPILKSPVNHLFCQRKFDSCLYCVYCLKFEMFILSFVNCFVVGTETKPISKSPVNHLFSQRSFDSCLYYVCCLKCGMLILSFVNCFVVDRQSLF